MRAAVAVACGAVLGAASLPAQHAPDSVPRRIADEQRLSTIPTPRMLAAPGFLLPVERIGESATSGADSPAHAPAGPLLVGQSGVAPGDDATPHAATGTAVASAPDARQRPADYPWWVPLASAAIPGAGQARLGQDRFIAYLALEGFLWARYAADRREALRERAAYRRVAMLVSRAAYPGDKPVGDFEYYERMEDWVASGNFDRDPNTAVLEPETDTTTYNGAMWLLARKTYWPTPTTPPPPGSGAALAALRFYEESAIRPQFQWSWRNARYEQDVFRRHIRASNEAYRHAIEDIGVVIANHVLSTVDAYISLRLHLGAAQAPGTREDVGLTATIPWEPLHPSPRRNRPPRRR